MDIVQARLVAINPVSRPQIITLNTLRNTDFVLGRANFFDGEDTIISRRHARFNVLPGSGSIEHLMVSNLSHVNGLLVNFEPLPPFDSTTVYDGDEICFSGAHGLTSRIEEEELPMEAQRYRYRVTIERGTRTTPGTSTAPQSRKRGREPIDVEVPRKRAREEDVILLSSDNDETRPVVVQGGSSGRRFSPVSVTSGTIDTSGTEDMDLDDTLVDDEISEADFLHSPKAVEGESSGTTSPDKGKGKETDIQQQTLDLQEELESTLVIVPHICSPCGHGGCGPCITKWFEKSETCPQCRAKLSTVNPFIRDYILERITDKYAHTILSAEEILDREQQALAFHSSQRQKAQDSNPKPIDFQSWSQRARSLNIPIPPEQARLTAQGVIELAARGVMANPPGWDRMTARAKGEYLRWRTECIDFHSRQSARDQRSTGIGQGGQGGQPRQGGRGRDEFRGTTTYATIVQRPAPTNNTASTTIPSSATANPRVRFQPVAVPRPTAEISPHHLVQRVETVAVARHHEWLKHGRPGYDGFIHANQPLLKPNLTSMPRNPGRLETGGSGRSGARGREEIPILPRPSNGEGSGGRQGTGEGQTSGQQQSRMGSARRQEVTIPGEDSAHLDAEWLREVTNVFGPNGIDVVISEQQRQLQPQPQQQQRQQSQSQTPQPQQAQAQFHQPQPQPQRPTSRQQRRQSQLPTIPHAPQIPDWRFAQVLIDAERREQATAPTATNNNTNTTATPAAAATASRGSRGSFPNDMAF